MSSALLFSEQSWGQIQVTEIESHVHVQGTESRQKIKHTAQVQIHLPHSQALFYLRHVSDSTKLSSSSSSLDLQCKAAFIQVHVQYLFRHVTQLLAALILSKALLNVPVGTDMTTKHGEKL